MQDKKLFNEYKKTLFEHRRTNEKISRADDLLREDDDNITSVIQDASLSNQEFIDIIALRRCEGYSKSAGGGNESAGRNTDRLYGKTPLKFVEEFLQNADDCQYDEEPRITINIDAAKGSIEFDYNERGFSREDIWSITSFESSTKSDESDRLLDIPEVGVFYKEKTGRKGIGFKSVFAIKADNVIIHICSNGYSFKLDNNIGRIIPVWEHSDQMDDHTHVTVELVNPEESLAEIYPEFRKLFCVDNIEELFKRSPALFMHRIKDITVNCISDNKGFYIQLSTDGSPIYDTPFNPEAPILSGISHNGRFYRSETAKYIVMTKDSEEGEQIFSCLRKTYMELVDDRYRNISFMAPVMDDSEELKWSSGSLFRTFPLFDETYDIPVSIDAPYELNTERRDIEYGEVGNARRLNTELSDLIFRKDGLLTDFYLTLRKVRNIRIDYYLSRKSILVFNKDGNKNSSGGEIVPHRDFMSVLKSVPLLKGYNDSDEFVSLANAVIADENLFDWPHADDLINILYNSSSKKLVSKFYKGSSLLRTEGVVDADFAEHINTYLDAVGSEYGIGADEFIEFMSNKLYPFLKNNSPAIAKRKQWGQLCILMSRLKVGKNIVVCRESFDAGNIWVSVEEGRQNLSLNNIRVIESSPVSPLVFKSEYQALQFSWGKSLYYELGENNIASTAKSCKNSTAIIRLFEDALFYGYSIEKLHPALLHQYVLSEKYDPDYNPFREAGVLDVIDDQLVEELASVAGIATKEAVKLLRKHGLRSGDDLINETTNYSELYLETVSLIGKLEPEKEVGIFRTIFRIIKISNKKLNFTYPEIKKASLNSKLYLSRNRIFLADEVFRKFSEEIISESIGWEIYSQTSSELILRSWRGATQTKLPRHYAVPCRISIERIIKSKLYKTVVYDINNHLSTLDIYSEGTFTEIPIDDIHSYVSILAGDKIDEISGDTKITFFVGALGDLENNTSYLYDSNRKHVFLNKDAHGGFADSLSSFLNTKFDPDKLELINKLESDVKDVKEKYILPALEEADHDNGVAFQNLHDKFQDLPKETVIRILSWFRYQGYAEGLGNASKNNEKEIEDDYRNNPWNFVYEFIQNVDDCAFPEGTVPSLNVVLNKSEKSISFQYNEMGFALKDIEAITQFGESNKAGVLDNEPEINGLFDRERTGRLGRGFKSVFALPGKSILVHINSNGYTFFFNKRLGQIIPIWEDSDKLPQGTRITVEGFKGSDIDDIYTHLQETFSVDKPEYLFSNCPVLYLRKLKNVSVSDGHNSFQISVGIDEIQYSHDNYCLHGEAVHAGIKEAGEYKTGMLQKIHIDFANNNKHETIPALQLSMMFAFRNQTSVATVTAPIISEKSGHIFTKGSFYRTLPLPIEQFNTPIAVNAQFTTDSGRQRIADRADSGNDELVEIIKAKLLEPFYVLLRTERGISINSYIPENGIRLFSKYSNIPEFNLSAFIRELPIVPLYSEKGFISCNDGRRLPEECYSWTEPALFMQILNGDDSDVLVGNDIKYVKRADVIDIDFVSHINEYLESVEQKGLDVYGLLKDYIIPYLTKNYDDIDAKLYSLKKQDTLKELRVFAFSSYDGTNFRESASSSSIWLLNCPTEYKSYGKYRSLSSAPVIYTKGVLEWVSKLHELVEFKKAFDRNTLGTSDADDWRSAKELIETIIYYQVRGSFSIPFLRECAMIPQYDQEDNIFRTAYLSLKNNNIIRHYITEDDIIEIWTDVGEIRDCDDEEIAKTIIRLGLRRGNDYFNISYERNVYFDSLTVKLLTEYCVDSEKANTVVKRIADRLKESSGEEHLSTGYDKVRRCSPIVFSAFFQARELPEQFRKAIAKALFDDEEKNYAEYDDFSEAILRGCAYLENETFKRSIKIKLSSVIERQLGNAVQCAVLRHSDSINLNIVLDIPTQSYDPENIEKALDWLSSYDDKEDFQMNYQYLLADISGAFETGYRRAPYLVDSSVVFLQKNDVQSSLITFVKDRYRTEDATFHGLVDIITRQNRLKAEWKQTKEDYIRELNRFRKETNRFGKILYPTIERNINAANGNAIDYIIPELLQNINDCHYSLEKPRELDIQIDTKLGQMILSYEEDGFSYANVYSITALGQSSKHDQSEGEKGLGFKKVFTLFDFVEIYSNGFNFYLKKDENTVPYWIDDVNKANTFIHNGKTTMVFYTADKQRLKKLEDKWKQLFNTPFAGNTVSPLFLNNIDVYSLRIDAQTERRLTRRDITKEYIIKEERIFPLYQKLLLDEGKSEEEENGIINNIAVRLRTRTKCKIMSDCEFNDYLAHIAVTVAFPRKLEKETNGLFYSTLPTNAKTHISAYINLPLELSTGRNEVMDESDFNKCIMEIVFGNKETGISIMDTILQAIAEENPEKEIFLYLYGHIKEYVQMLSSKTGQVVQEFEDSIDKIKIFHAYPDRHLTSLSSSFSVEPILYRYLARVGTEVNNDIYEWLQSNTTGIENCDLIYVTQDIDKMCEALKKFNVDLERPKGYVPLQTENEDVVMDYFIAEYGASYEEGEDDGYDL